MFVVVRVLTVCHASNNNEKNKDINRNNKTADKKYDRQIAAMCLTSSAGNNGVLILVATKKNENRLFQAYREGRDNANGLGCDCSHESISCCRVVWSGRPQNSCFGV
jgi:hypothetical protein